MADTTTIETQQDSTEEPRTTEDLRRYYSGPRAKEFRELLDPI